MEILDNLHLHGNQIIDAYLQGTAQQVKNPLNVQIVTPNGIQEVSYNGSNPKSIILSAQTLGAVSAVKMDTGKNLPIYQGLVTIPTISGPQGLQGLIGLQGSKGVQGVQGPQGVQGVQGLQGKLGLQGISGNLMDAYYNNSNPMTADVGGLKKGTTFNNMPLKDLLDKLLYPYMEPLVSIKGSESILLHELGTSIQNCIITGTYTKTSENLEYVSLISSSKGDLIKEYNKTTSGSIKYTESQINQTTKYTLEVKDLSGIKVTSSLLYEFIYPVYIGTSSIIPSESQELKELLEYRLQKSGSITYKLTEKIISERFMIACPPGWKISSIKDPTGQENIKSFTSKSISIDCLDGTSQTYTLYYGLNPTTQESGFYLTFQ